MTTPEVAETSITVNNNNSPIQDYVYMDDHAQRTCEMTPGFKPITEVSVYEFFCLSFYFYCKNRSLLSSPKGIAV